MKILQFLCHLFGAVPEKISQFISFLIRILYVRPLDLIQSLGHRIDCRRELLILLPTPLHPGEHIASVVKKFKERLARLLDVDPAELRDPFAGPLAMYLAVPPGGGPDDVQGVLIAGVGELDVMQSYLNAVTARLKEAATGYETVSAGRHTIQVFTSSGAAPEEEEEDEFDFDEGGPSPLGMGMGPEALTAAIDDRLEKVFSLEDLPEELAVCLADDRLYVAGSADHIKRALAQERGGQTLAETDDHQALLQNLKPVGQVRLLINLPRLFEMAKAEGDQDAVSKWLGILGAGSLRSVVGHARIGTKSYESKLELMFLMRGERTGLA